MGRDIIAGLSLHDEAHPPAEDHSSPAFHLPPPFFGTRPSRLALGVGVAMVAAVLGVTVFLVMALRTNVLAEAEHNQRRLTFLLAEHTASLIQGIDLQLIHAVQHLVEPPGRDGRHPHLTPSAALRAGLTLSPAVQQLVAFDRDGRMTAWSEPGPLPAITILDRPYFQRLRDEAGSGMVISGPIQSRIDNRWTFTLSRRINDAGGAFSGAVVAVANLNFLENFYGSLGLGNGAEVSLLLRDQQLLARHPHRDPGGREPGNGRETAGGREAGRVIASHELPNQPLLIRISTPEITLLEPWRHHAIIIGAGGAAISLVLIVLLAFLVRLNVRRELGEAALLSSHQSLAENRERLGLILEASNDGFWEWRLDSDEMFWSDRCFALLGLTPDETPMRAEDVLTLLHPDDLPRYRAEVRRHLEQGTQFEIEARWRGVDSRYLWLLSRGRAVAGPDGHPDRLVGANTEITRRKEAELQAEAASRRVETEARRTQGILSSMIDGVVVIDEAGIIQDFNPAAERLFGCRAGEVLGTSINRLIPTPHEFHHDDYIRRWLQTGEARAIGRTHELEARRMDGRTFPVELSVSALTIAPDADPSGIPRHQFVGSVRDISGRKNMESALIRAKALAESANRAKSEFMANISHELRTPLNAVIGFSEILERQDFGPLGEPHYLDFARHIRQSGQHLLEIITDILDISALDAGLYELVEEPLILDEIVRASLTRIAPRAEESRITIDDQVPGDLPLILADARALKQIIGHLVSNAVKFTLPDGRVTLSAGIEAGGTLRFVVQDTGIGIADDKLDQIMKPFGQAESGFTRDFEGLGLGLAVVRGLVEAHGGTLAVTSRVGIGTSVQIELPAARVLPETPHESRDNTSAGGAAR